MLDSLELYRNSGLCFGHDSMHIFLSVRHSVVHASVIRPENVMTKSRCRFERAQSIVQRQLNGEEDEENGLS